MSEDETLEALRDIVEGRLGQRPGVIRRWVLVVESIDHDMEREAVSRNYRAFGPSSVGRQDVTDLLHRAYRACTHQELIDYMVDAGVIDPEDGDDTGE